MSKVGKEVGQGYFVARGHRQQVGEGCEYAGKPVAIGVVVGKEMERF